MSQTLSRMQALVLGIVVLVAVAGGATGLAAIAAKQGLWAETFEVRVQLAEAHDIAPGTPVRIRGIEAGQVVAVEDAEEAVVVRMKLDARYRGKLYANGTAGIQATGLLGSKIVAIAPGTAASGPLANDTLAASNVHDVAEKLNAVADEAAKLLRDVRTGKGTLAKLVQDDELYNDLKGVAKKADSAVGKVEAEVSNVRDAVKQGQETFRSVKQGTDALQRLPLVRSYVEDAAGILVKPTHHRDALTYNAIDLFEPGTAILTGAGKDHLNHAATWVKDAATDKSEIAVAALCDPNDAAQTSASAAELTRRQAAAALAHLRDQKAHKTGFWTWRNRTCTPIGLGMGPSPVVSTEPLPASYLQVVVFTPR